MDKWTLINIFRFVTGSSLLANLVSADIACTGGAKDVRAEDALTIKERKRSPTIKRIQRNHQESNGQTGISPENRRIGVEVEYSILYIIAKAS